MVRKKRNNPLIDNITAQTSVISADLSSSNEHLESKSTYENLTEELSKIQNDPEFNTDVILDENTEDIEKHTSEDLEKLLNYEAFISELSVINSALKNENMSLQEENDKYLMKISELTFENAKLNALLQELSKNANVVNNNSTLKFNERTIPNMIDSSKKLSTRHSAKKVNYPYKTDNIGYTAWN